MNKQRFYLLIVFLILSKHCQALQTELATKINEYMKRSEANGFSGALLIAKDGHIILSEGYGLADRAKNTPVTPKTVFTIGSITKQFTAAAILKLQEQGKLDVNDPITKYFKDVPADKAGITLHHLLTHTAGFPGAIGDDFAPVTRDEFIQLAMKTELKHKQGELYEYSNVGYSLLGAIIEIVTGESYEVFLNEYLFTPAGMKNTGYKMPKWNPEDIAHGYRGDTDWGTLLDKPWADDGPYWHLRANGGILSTMEDMYLWHLALLSDKVLTKKSKQALFTPYVKEGKGADSYYGYGWAIFETPRGTKLIAHNGGNMIFAADFRRYVDEDVVILIASNTAGNSGIRISPDIARIVFGYDYRLPPEKIERPTVEQLKQSELGNRALALLDIYASTDEMQTRKFIQANFEPGFVKRVTLDKLLQIIQTDQEGIGACDIGKIVQLDSAALELTVQSKHTGEWWLISLTFEKEAPHRITGIGIQDTPPPAEVQLENIKTSSTANWGLPDSNTGHRSAAVLEAINRMDEAYAENFIKTNFAPEFLNAFSLEEHLNQFKRMHTSIGKLKLLDAQKTGPNAALLRVESLNSEMIFTIEIQLEDQAPWRIAGMRVEVEE